MSDQTSDQTGRKQRVSLTLESDVVIMGEELAKEEKRSLSNLVEVLFEREHKRVFGPSKEVSQADAA